MNSWFVWIAFVLVAVVLGLIAYWFSLRVLRVVAAIVALVTAAYLTWYGLTHPAKPPGGLSDAFAWGADELVRALFYLPPVRHCAIGAPFGKNQRRTPMRHWFFTRRACDNGADRLRH